MKNLAPLPPRTLAATGLSCERSEHVIFSDIDIDVGPSQALLLRGPNGAGKTSLLMCLADFLHISSGKLNWIGRDSEHEPGSDMHFIGHQSAVKPGLTSAENLEFWAILHGGNVTRIPEALQAANLDHAADIDAALLSAGQTRRLALARLLVTPRPIWLLDEPTSALDVDGDKWVGRLIDQHLDEGGLTIAATHLDLNLRKKNRILTLTIGGKK